MREIPLKVYLDWPAPNYENPETRGGALLAVNIVFIILVTLSVIVRLYSRIVIKCQGGIDDAMIVLAYVFTVGMTAVVLLANRQYGWNRHTWDVPADMIQNANIIAYSAKIMFTFAASFTRLSLIFLYYRLIKDTNIRGYLYALHFSLAFNIAVCITFVFLSTFACVPVQAYWQFPNVIDGRCMDEGVSTLAAGVVNCVADLLCTVLPIPVVLSLRMPLRQRIGVCFLLSAGIVVTIAGVVRTYFIWKSLIATYDESWFTYPLWISAALEIDIAVISACVPAMKTVLWKPFRRWTNDVYTHWTTSHRGSRTRGVQLSSQDPAVDSAYGGSNRGHYALNNMGSEKSAPRKGLRDTVVLEQAIAQLPPAGHHHPHTGQLIDHEKGPKQDPREFAQALYNPQRDRLEIQKETGFKVSCTSDARKDRHLPYAPPPGQLPHRPRHQPLMPTRRGDDVTPRSLDVMASTRRNVPAALPPSSPQPIPVSQNTTEPLPPPTPMSMMSDDSEPAMTARKDKRKGGTFFFG